MSVIVYIVAVWFGGVLLVGGVLAAVLRMGALRLVAEHVPMAEGDAERIARQVFAWVITWPLGIVRLFLVSRQLDNDDEAREIFRRGVRAGMGIPTFTPVNYPREECVATTEPQPRFEFEDPPDCTEECARQKSDWMQRYVAAHTKWQEELRAEREAEP